MPIHRRDVLRATAALAVAAPFSRFSWSAAEPTADIEARRLDGSAVTISAAELKALRSSLRGPLLLPTDAGYDRARQVLNAAIDRRPALVIQPVGAADVCIAVQFARSRDLLLAVKCGGHSFSGLSTCNGGMQIDLSQMRGVRVDAAARRAWVEGGTLLGAVDHEAMAVGLVTPLGTVSHTGAGGLTTGGGFGRMARRFGLAADNVVAVDLVTADGRLYRATAADNPDLFWAVRGGGGNFGIVTSFEYRLHPAERQVVGGSFIYPADRAQDVLRWYADNAAVAPDDLYLDAWATHRPGKTSPCGIDVCYSGPQSGAERALASVRKLGTPAIDDVKVRDYVELQRSTDSTDARNTGEYTKSGFVPAIPYAAVDTLLTGLRSDPNRSATAYFQHAGGAIARVDPAATAFPHRFAVASMMLFADWPLTEDGSVSMDWARGVWKSLEPYTRGFYVNEVEGNEGAAALNSNYLGNYPRLAEIKKQYDPTNQFRLNANITPAA
jgi:FAD/FMN-containing dehydrogenase